jgi:hypothetical protein
VALALSCLCTLAGCAGEGPPPPGTSSSFDTIQRTIFDVNCLSAGCHNQTDQAGDLVLVAGQSYANLVNVVPFNPAASAAGLLRVVPDNPDQSFLIVKLTDPGPDEGSRMPLAAEPLSDADIATINAWILEGAPPPATPSPTATPTHTPEPLAAATVPAAR